MKRTTITLSDDVALAVQREARRRRVSVSEVIRQALALGLGIRPDDRRALLLAAIGRSRHRHTARDLEAPPGRSGSVLAIVDAGPLCTPSRTRTTRITGAAGTCGSAPTSSSSWPR